MMNERKQDEVRRSEARAPMDPATEPTQLDVRTPLLLRLIAYGFAAGLVGTGGWLLAYSFVDWQPWGLGTVVMFVAFGLLFWRMATLRLLVRADMVEVRNYFRTHRFPLSHVAAFEVGFGVYGIDVQLTTGKKVRINVIQKNSWAIGLGKRTKADALVDELNQLVGSAAGHSDLGVSE